MPERHDLPNGRRRERLECAGDGCLAIEHIRNENFCREFFFTEFFTEFQRFDRVEKFDHFLVGAIAESAQKSGREKFPAAFAAIEIDVEQIAGIKLHFDPGTAIRNNPETVKDFAVEMDARLECDPGRTMQLTDHNTLRSVNDKRSLRGHERNFAHVNFLFLRPLFLAELESDMERGAVGLTFSLRLERG